VAFAVPGNVQAALAQVHCQNKTLIPQLEIHQCLVCYKSGVVFQVLYHRNVLYHAGTARLETAFVTRPVCAAPDLDIVGLQTRIAPIQNCLVVMV
jgi:hypothetical protein